MQPVRAQIFRYIIYTLLCLLLPTKAVFADATEYAVNIYGGKLTNNNWEEFFTGPNQLNFIDSKLLAITLAKRLGGNPEQLSYEAEAQVVKHFGIQKHWELNALGVTRWEPFWWDRFLDTSAAFGLGLSYATEKPRAEEINEGSTDKWMIYWMMELAFSLPQQPHIAVISRLHHRSEAYGLIADEGGSNALTIGIKYRF